MHLKSFPRKKIGVSRDEKVWKTLTYFNKKKSFCHNFQYLLDGH